MWCKTFANEQVTAHYSSGDDFIPEKSVDVSSGEKCLFSAKALPIIKNVPEHVGSQTKMKNVHDIHTYSCCSKSFLIIWIKNLPFLCPRVRHIWRRSYRMALHSEALHVSSSVYVQCLAQFIMLQCKHHISE